MTIHVRSRAGIAFVTATAALALTACGGGAKRTDDGKIDGAESAPAAASASPGKASPPAGGGGGGAERPKITLPDDVHNVFEGGKTGDPQKDAILADNEQRINSVDEVVTSGDLNRPGLKYYSAEGALASAVKYIKGFESSGTSFTGTTRYYNRTVTLLKTDGLAVLTYCSDATKAYSKDRKSGKVDMAPGSDQDYAFYNTRLKKNSAGVWQTVSVVSEGGSTQCRS
ncbi:hypothetical protein AB0L26_14545 [Streptomyces nondiastaticus]|uniref:hypothetical protein n=1 Tax=Streptomyces nondiastaticus TaxID=3154512 RepID=UPI0034329DAE